MQHPTLSSKHPGRLTKEEGSLKQHKESLVLTKTIELRLHVLKIFLHTDALLLTGKFFKPVKAPYVFVLYVKYGTHYTALINTYGLPDFS